MCLIVSQTEEVHEEVEKVLTSLRSIPTSKGAPIPVRRRADAGGDKGAGRAPMGGVGGMGGMGGMGGVGAGAAY